MVKRFSSCEGCPRVQAMQHDRQQQADVVADTAVSIGNRAMKYFDETDPYAASLDPAEQAVRYQQARENAETFFSKAERIANEGLGYDPRDFCDGPLQLKLGSRVLMSICELSRISGILTSLGFWKVEG